MQLRAPSGLQANLTVMGVEWADSSLMFYTDNPIAQITAGSTTPLPMTGSPHSRRLLISLDQLNIQLSFKMRRAVINEILPKVRTNGQELSLQYSL
jgi:hypothetical protein